MAFLREVFSDGGPGSFGRFASIPTVLTACFVILYLALRNHAAPDPMTIGALGVFAISPYTSGKVAGIFTGKTDSQPNAAAKQ